MKRLQASTFLSLLLCFALCSGAANTTSPRVSESQALTALKAELEKRAAEDRFAGVVLVAKDGKPAFQAAYGDANREKHIRNTLDTKFRFGSMGKMFTAVAVLQLAQAGKIALNDPLGKFLPDYPNKEVAKVSIHQLLTHTGGTGNIFGAEFDSNRAALKDLKDYVALYGRRNLEFEPGSRHEYSNYGFILLGRIIEVVSGQSYEAYVRDQVFKPAGMSSTDNLPEEQRVAGLAIPYTSNVNPGPGLRLRRDPPEAAQQPSPQKSSVAPDLWRSAEDSLPYSGTAAGGGYSTAADLLAFADALTTYKLLDARHTDLLTSGKVDTPMRGMKYAYGFEDASLPDGARRFGHGGGAPGMNGVLSVFPASHYVVVVLANLDPPAATEIEQFISARLPAK